MCKRIFFSILLFISFAADVGASDIFVKDASTVWSDSLIQSEALNSLAQNVSPRIIMEYSNSSFHADLTAAPQALSDLVKSLPETQRLIINGACSAFQAELAFNGIPLKITDNKQTGELPKKFELYQNYPNPFNSATIIAFDLPRPTFVKLTIFDIEGRIVKVLLRKNMKAAAYKIHFDGCRLASGLYFYQLQFENRVLAKKLVLLR